MNLSAMRIYSNHMNQSVIWEIIALSHVLEGRVIHKAKQSAIISQSAKNSCDYLATPSAQESSITLLW